MYNGKRNKCVHCKTDTDELNIVVYRYRNNLYFKDFELDLQLTEYYLLLAKQIYLLSYIDIFHNRCIVWDEATGHK